MNNIISTNIFRVPKLDAKLLSVSALLLAMDVILYRISIGPAFAPVTFGFISMALMGYLYGPVWAGILEMISNVICFTVFGSGTFQIAFLIGAFLGGFINVLFLYQKKINVFSVILSQLIIMIPISLLLNSWLMSILFNANFQAIFWSRLFRNLALIPIQIIIIMVVFTALEKRGLFKTFKL